MALRMNQTKLKSKWLNNVHAGLLY